MNNLKIIYLFALLAICFSVQATDTKKKHFGYSDREIMIEVEDTLNRFNKELAWHLSRIGSYSPQYEQELKKYELWDITQKNDQILKSHLALVPQLFLDFRGGMLDTILANWNYSPHGRSLCLYTSAEMTDWYIQLMRESFFPENWEKAYESDLQDQLTKNLPSKLYAVKTGDTLYKIASEQLGDSKKAQEIEFFNHISDVKNLKPGVVIKLPFAAYKVKKEDTLSSIAQDQLGDASKGDTIAKLNELQPPYSLQTDQIIYLPIARVVLDPE